MHFMNLFVFPLDEMHFCVVPPLLFAGPKDVKDIFSALKDSAAEHNGSNDTLKHQVLLKLADHLFSFLFWLWACKQHHVIFILLQHLLTVCHRFQPPQLCHIL